MDADAIDRAWDTVQEQNMLAEEARRWAVEQQDTEGRWWRGGDTYLTEADAREKAAWMDCPARVVIV